MAEPAAGPDRAPPPAPIPARISRLAIGLGIALALGVYALNGAPLYYFDSASYLAQGYSMLEALGLPVADAVPAGGGSAAAGGGAAGADDTVDASRSAAYGLALAALDAAGLIDAAVAVNLGVIWLAVWLVARRLARPCVPAALVTGVAMAVASLGALPFYVAFLMPDILAPVLILMLALIGAWLPDLSRAERVAAAGLALIAILSHPSHLLIAALMLPALLWSLPGLRGRRRWVGAGLVVLLVGAGLGERAVFAALVARFEAREVRVLPFLTARLIDDGPGRSHLAARCPDPGLATCALWQALALSDDPERFNAPQILFSRDPATASLRRLDEAGQTAVAREQLRFAVAVLRAEPLAVLAAIGRNTLVQLGYVRVDMTIPAAGGLDALRAIHGAAADGLRDGRLIGGGRGWLPPLAVVHIALYALSGLAVLALVARRGGLPAGSRRFAVLVLFGILANALVCGSLSEPAFRYGARVALLVPILAVLLAFGRVRDGGRSATRSLPAPATENPA